MQCDLGDAEQAYRESGTDLAKPGFDVAEVADATPYQQLVALEGLGLCPREQWVQAVALRSEWKISAPVRTPFGWHIIQVLERRKQDVTADKERVRAQIAIRQRKSDEAFQDWVRQVRDRAYVEVRLDDR